MSQLYHILYVDDEPALLDITKMFLEDIGGFSVDCAISGSEALNRIVSGNYDAVVSDYQMQGMDGITLLKKVRDTYKTLPFILFTGRGREEVVIEAINSGVDFYLQKGGEPRSQYAELSHKIRMAIARSTTDNALKESGELYRNLVETTGTGYVILDKEGRVTTANDEYLRLTGRSSFAEIEGRPVTDWTAPYDLERNVREIELSFRTGQIRGLEVDYQKPDGTFQPVEINASVVQSGPEQIILTLCRDIAERKRTERELAKKVEELNASLDQLTTSHEELRRTVDELNRSEQALKSSEGKYRMLVENIPDKIFVKDASLTYVSGNENYCQGLGIAADEIAGKTDFDFYPRDLAEKYRTDDRAVIESATPIRVEERYTVNGRESWIFTSKTPIRDEAGNVTGILGIFHDITERKRIREVLLESERKFHNLYQFAQVGLFETSLKDGTVVACNERYATLAGYLSVEDAIGKDVVHLYENTDDRKEVIRILREQGHIDDHIVQFKNHLTGRPFWAQFSARINREKDIAEGTIVDITERKQIEQELERKNEELTVSEEELKSQFDDLIDTERTLQISEERLLMAQDISHTGCWEYSVETNKIWGSAEALRIYGFPPEAGYYPIEVIEACVVDRQWVQQAFVDFINGRRDYDIEITINPFDGSSQRVVHSMARLEKDAQGKLNRVIGVLQDITERRQAEEALRESEERFRAIFNASFQFTGLMKTDGTLIEANQSAMDFAGITSDQVINKPFWETHWWRGNEKRVRDLKDAIARAAAGQFVRYEVELQGAGDSRGLFDFSIKPVFDTDGTVVLIVPEGRDISSRKQAEDALVRVNKKLNILNDLTRRDLTSRIFVLKSYLEFAKYSAVGQDSVLTNLQKIEPIMQSINEITEFTKDYQNMGETPPMWQNVKLTMLYGISHIFLGDVRQSLETENLEIFADPLLEKAFQGLFENTIAHGGQVSQIRVWYKEIPEGVVIVFENNGAGIQEDRKEQIFLRGEGTRSPIRGLFFVREILDLTGITIHETGDPDRGVRFEIIVPKGAYHLTGIQ